MPDFPAQTMAPLPGGTMVTTSTASMLGEIPRVSYGAFSTGSVWPAANRAIYWPFIIQQTVIAQHMGIEVVTQSGNMDVGIYDVNGVRLASMGSTAVAAAGIQTFNIADTTLTPGVYWAAMCVDNGVASFIRSASVSLWLQVMGVQQQAVGAVTLPDPAVFANPAANYVPFMSVGFKSTI